MTRSRDRGWRSVLVLIVAGVAWVAAGGRADTGRGAPAGRLTLVPLDERPAVGQFAVMVGAVADHLVEMPPREWLGNFTTPGDTARIAQWLRTRDYRGTDALVISVDMLAYGGLVASRTHGVGLDEARTRLDVFRWFRRHHPAVKVYAFNAIMRVAPTASAATHGMHDRLARWAELKDRAPRTGDAGLAAELERLERELPPRAIDDYLAARRRNLQVTLATIDLAKAGLLDALILLQDDAREFGLHRQDQAVLRARVKELGLEGRVPIYNGTDEGAISLVSRAVLARTGTRIRVAPVYSSEKARDVIAPFEDHPLRFTVEHQIRAAGGVPVGEEEPADYRLYVNAPETTDEEFDGFLRRMLAELMAGQPVALADLLFPRPHRSGADERIIAALRAEHLFDRFVGYAAWNTAGNTLGTAVPHANMRLYDQRWLRRGLAGGRRSNPRRTELAHLAFLLNRFAGDYLYHVVVRPQVNARLREEAARTNEITYQLGAGRHAAVDREVSQAMVPAIRAFFADHFAGRRHRLTGSRVVWLTGLREPRVYLPWARTFECAIELGLEFEEGPDD